MRFTRAKYHRAVRNPKEREMYNQQLHFVLARGNSDPQFFWSEIKKSRNRNVSDPVVDNACTYEDICDVFKNIYTSVPTLILLIFKTK
jgi:hypothetical protein